MNHDVAPAGPMPILSGFVSRTLEHRDYAVDALRGLAIAGMILVNDAPPTDSIYAPLVHMPWDGWSLADTIFPVFLFIVGVSIGFSLRRSPVAGGVASRSVHWRITRRTMILFALNVLLLNFPYYELHKLRLTGVLSHIAVCYLAVALIHLHTSWRAQVALIPAIWLLHWALLSFFTVPEFGAGVLTPEGNASRYVDQLLLGPHSSSLRGETDIDGILVSLSSITTVIIGLLTGRWLVSDKDVSAKIAGMFMAGFALFLVGNAWGLIYPVNKPLWTGSFVALTAGIALQLLAAGYWVMELHGSKSWAKPLQIAGVNALTFYILAASLQRVFVYGRVQGEDGAPVRLRYLIYERLFAPWAPGEFGALLYTLVFLAICFGFIVLLYNKRVFIKL